MYLLHKSTRSDSNSSHVDNVETNLEDVDIYNYTWDPDSSRLQQPDLTHHRQCKELQVM